MTAIGARLSGGAAGTMPLILSSLSEVHSLYVGCVIAPPRDNRRQGTAEGEWVMRGGSIFIAATALAIGATGTVLVAAEQGRSADRSETVGGWRIEDVTRDDPDDPAARIVRMTRDVDGHRLSYETNLYVDAGPNWGDTTFSVGTYHQSRSCSHSGSAAVEIGPAAQRGARVRDLLTRELRRAERDCGETPGALDMLLAGFAPAFARLSAIHDQRFAELEAAAATATPDNMDEAAAFGNGMTADYMNMDGMETDMNGDDGDVNMAGMDPPDESEAAEAPPKAGGRR